MPKPKTKIVTTTTPPVSLPERLTQLKVALGALINPTELLELLMQLLAQELLLLQAQGQPLSEHLPLLDGLMRYEALRLRRESLTLRQRKAKSADYFPEEAPKPLGAPDPAPPEVVEYINAIRRKMWGRLPEDSPPPGTVTPPAPSEAEPAPEVSTETAVTTADPAEIPGTPEYEAKMAVARARIKELEAERDRLNQEAEDRWLRIQAIEAKQQAEQQASYDPARSETSSNAAAANAIACDTMVGSTRALVDEACKRSLTSCAGSQTFNPA
jgi:hypothetical protein